MAKAKKSVMVQIPSSAIKNEVTIEWGGYEICVTRTITLPKMLEFVANAAESCFGDDGSFIPEIMDFAVKSNIISMYTNIKLPKDLKKQYELLYMTNLCEEVVKQINNQQITEILNSVASKVKYNADSRVNQAHAEIRKIAEGFAETKERLDILTGFFSDADIREVVEKFANMDEKAFVREYAATLQHNKIDTAEEAVPVTSIFGKPEVDA